MVWWNRTRHTQDLKQQPPKSAVFYILGISSWDAYRAATSDLKSTMVEHEAEPETHGAADWQQTSTSWEKLRLSVCEKAGRWTLCVFKRFMNQLQLTSVLFISKMSQSFRGFWRSKRASACVTSSVMRRGNLRAITQQRGCQITHCCCTNLQITAPPSTHRQRWGRAAGADFTGCSSVITFFSLTSSGSKRHVEHKRTLGRRRVRPPATSRRS